MMSFTHKTGKILFGILIIAVAVFLLLESFGVISASGILSIPFWKLGLSLLLVWQMINELRHPLLSVLSLCGASPTE